MLRWLTLFLMTMRWAMLGAQSQVSVTHFDEFSGMAQWYVTQIVQDRSGMIWMSTWNGLNRYDGYQFECFKTQVGDGCDMSSDRIANIMLNDEGNLWCKVEDRALQLSGYLPHCRTAQCTQLRGAQRRHGGC